MAGPVETLGRPWIPLPVQACWAGTWAAIPRPVQGRPSAGHYNYLLHETEFVSLF
jgi:hypothetical protein